ncbi:MULTISPECIES: o-succinylbenzoate synthase [Aeromicrobium]|uniref:o-succinylbenzoate synthase n=1 Tax=Aeromicrobium piscarium TaxID=2590901 RepID=A0A554SPL4_9ACTN|nr:MULTISPECIES: o-succinylbenzoate synthase [Aeromicrobium]TSD68292.1 O-succinylbenzoate synthase [Aeromicrobium piscarium]
MQFRTFTITMPTTFRGVNRREGMVVRGEVGWAEFSPFLDYSAVECVPWYQAALDSANRPWPDRVRDRVPVNITVPAVDPDHAARIVLGSTCRTAKVKVAEGGQCLADDIARVEAVRDALPLGGHLRIDANGGWEVGEAVKAIRKLDKAARGLEYVEQPCATAKELAEVRKKVEVPIAADESIRRSGDPFRVRDLEAADIAVLKVQPLGGIHACYRIAEQIDMPVVVSSAVETSIGLAAGIALAAALPDLPFACGLATTSLLAGDVVTEPLHPVDGCLPVIRPELDERAFARVAAPEDIDERWQLRLEAVREELEE